MSQVERKWVADRAINNEKIDEADTYDVNGLLVDSTSAVGGVGIGTVSPLDALHIRRTATEAGIRVDLDDGASGRAYKFYTEATGLLNVQDANTGTDRLTVDGPNGRVGINTTAPTDTLHVQSLSSMASMQLDLNDGVSGRAYQFSSDSTGNLLINDLNDSSTRLRIDSGGSLHIENDATILGNFQVDGDVVVINTEIVITDQLEINQTQNQAALIASQDTGGTTATVVRIENAGNGAALTTDNGNVGIGSAIPDQPLTVIGNIRGSTGITAGTGIISTTGNIVATTGDIVATLGLVSAGSTMTAGTGMTSTTGNIIATAGAVNAGTSMTAGTGITSTAGNIIATAGAVNAGTSMTAATGITAGTGIISTTGNIVATLGSVSAGSTITAATNITATAGYVNAGTSMTATTGPITASAGNIVATLGAVNAGTSMTATTGPITASAGNILALTGSIGVGTAVPDKPLHVYGATYAETDIQSGDLNVKLLLRNSGGNAADFTVIGNATPADRKTYVGPVGGGQLHLRYDTGQSGLVILESGYVGIGTAVPEKSLHVYGATFAETDIQSGDRNVKLLLRNLDGPAADFTVIGNATPADRKTYVGPVGGGQLHLRYDTGQSGLVILSTGIVGIGTAVPEKSLHVYGATFAETDIQSGDRNVKLLLRNLDGNAADFTVIGDAVSVDRKTLVGPVGGGQLHLRYGSGQSGIVILESGYVGIGTTVPLANTHILGASSVLRLQSTAATSPEFQIYRGGTAYYKVAMTSTEVRMGSVQSTNTFIIAGNTDAIGINGGNQNVGIGTVPLSSNKLEVIGNIVSSGSVGVGTITPSENLESYHATRSMVTARVVDGNYTAGFLTKFGGVTQAKFETIRTAGVYSTELGAESGDLKIRANGASPIWIGGTNNWVGIGTTPVTDKGVFIETPYTANISDGLYIQNQNPGPVNYGIRVITSGVAVGGINFGGWFRATGQTGLGSKSTGCYAEISGGGSATNYPFEDMYGNYTNGGGWVNMSDPARKTGVREIIQDDIDLMWNTLDDLNVKGFRVKADTVIGYDEENKIPHEKDSSLMIPAPIYDEDLSKYPEVFGLMANELPDFLKEADEKGVNAKKLADYLIVIAQVQKEKINALESRVAALEV